MKLLGKILFVTTAVFALACSSVGSVSAQQQDLSALFATKSEFLKVDEAFQLTTDVLDNEIIARFEIADAYYMYRSRFFFNAEGATLGEAQIPDGKKKVDEYLGDVEVYYNHLEIVIPFTAHQKEFEFSLEFQGCAEAGLCYPPEEKRFTLLANNVVAKPVAIGGSDGSGGGNASDSNSGLAASGSATSTSAQPSANTATQSTLSEPVAEEFQSEQELILGILSEGSLLEIVIWGVLGGILLAFTPCVLPMVPILSSIIVGQGKEVSTGKAFGLSLAYTQAMAIPYTLLGILAASLGEGFSTTLQQPLFIGITAVIFLLLSLSMFGFYELQLPQGLQNRINNLSNSQESGSYVGAGVMGALSALVVSPCVTVPLSALLIYIAKTGDIVIGGVGLYALAVGMGIPLIMVGVGGGKFLPKAGAWMNAIKAGFGVVMIGMALYISKHLIPGPLYLFAWSVLLIVTAIYMGALSQVETNAQKFWKGTGLVMFVYGIILVIGASLGNGRLLSPLANVTAIAAHSGQGANSVDPHAMFEKVKTIADVEAKIRQANAEGKTVMFDFFAEYCTACYEFADYTFPDPAVQAALGNTVLIQADVTKGDADDKALMKHYGILGLPSILFFDANGEEDERLRATGFEKADVFVQRINAAYR
ncbi:protein-disulfide reductase DsbD [Aliikangiella marina]|uniref:Thiol:disulfide interchange protein DsbD n=1 Tax=Aliikangiella marina TaxID=1712262 RepID=A0A545T102_9GAMM|nr:protein-disulfide reductase DsbD [Aliikangiella marina]TQV70896.1 protein-disulfide reductase DsbD [Aliikangiella marina]